MQRLLNIRAKSLARGNLAVFAALALALWMSGAPRLHTNPWIILPFLLSIYGTVETVRNIRPRWSFYHAGVLLCMYMDLMAVSLVLFLLAYPYLDLGVR